MREAGASVLSGEARHTVLLDAPALEAGVEIGSISTGPERNQTIVRPESRLAKLLA